MSWRFTSFILAAILFLHCLLFFALPEMPFLDLPSHIGRASIISHLLTDGQFSHKFSVELGFRPYLPGDLLFAAMLLLLNFKLAGMLWMTMCFLVIPLGIACYMRSLGLSSEKIIIGAILSVYLATDWFFLAAYSHYRLGIGAAFFSMSAFEFFTNRSRHRTTLAYMLFCMAALTTYSFHFASFFFLCVIVGVSTATKLVWQKLPWFKAALVLIPCLFLGLYHVFVNGAENEYLATWGVRSLVGKLSAVGTMFVRFDLRIDIVLFCAFMLLLLALVAHSLLDIHQQIKDPQIRELCAILLSLVLLYGLLPVSAATLYDVDGRALPFIFIFLIIIALRLHRSSSFKSSNHLAGVVLLVLFNYLYIAKHLREENAFLGGYHQALLSIPAKKRVLPISSREPRGRIDSALHFGALYSVERGGFTPYISSSRLGEPFSYFHYRDTFYAPSIFWYIRNKPVRWEKIENFFDYLVITKPFDQARLKLPNLAIKFTNDAATVFEIAPKSTRQLSSSGT